MTIWEAVALGIIQALTEFLPVSSSGHLVLFQYLFGLHEPLIAFDVLLHAGSLLAVVLYYRKTIAETALAVFRPRRAPQGRRLIGLIVLASLPAAVIGLGFESLIESLFQSPAAVGLFWLLTAGLLFAGGKAAGGNRTIAELTAADALLIGLFQGLAILPGVSRSGATIVMGMIAGLHPKEAANFSFLIYIPAVFGAALLQLGDLAGTNAEQLRVFIVGGAAAAVFSYLAIAGLLRLLQRRVIRPFAWYCLAAGMATLMFLTLW